MAYSLGVLAANKHGEETPATTCIAKTTGSSGRQNIDLLLLRRSSRSSYINMGSKKQNDIPGGGVDPEPRA